MQRDRPVKEGGLCGAMEKLERSRKRKDGKKESDGGGQDELQLS